MVINKRGSFFFTFKWDIPVLLYKIVKHKQNTAKHNSVDDFIKVYSDIISFNEIFRLQLHN
jgi:hypothetical protein